MTDSPAHTSAPGATPEPPSPPLPASLQPLPPGAGEPIPRLHNFLFHSAIRAPYKAPDRVVSIYLPPQYELEPDRRFPVLYLHDGQNLIDPHTSYLPGHTWRAGEAADTTNAAGHAQPLILVGIANTGLGRMAEYTPSRDYRMGGGEGTSYGRLLIEELKPWVDSTFRTLPGPASTGLGGSSLGGLITLFLGLQNPTVFTRLAVLSPSVWWDHRSILSVVARTHPRPPLRIWLDIGTAEGARHVRDTEALNANLVKLGFTPATDLHFEIIPDAPHTEDAWAARLPQVLTFLFPLEPPQTPGAPFSAQR